jgi:hypothetical protein
MVILMVTRLISANLMSSGHGKEASVLAAVYLIIFVVELLASA